MHVRPQDAVTYMRAFERNCPHVRMLKDEREELVRLFRVAQQDAVDCAARSMTKAEGDDNG